ncbi:MAG: ribonuclease HI family protein [Patescibacteria group bacterium]
MFYLNTDGASRGNPGLGACAFVLKNDKGVVLEEGGEFLGKAVTNNFAEYKGLILGLLKASEKDMKILTCRLDSELVVKQLKGEYRVKDTHLKDLFLHLRGLTKAFDYIEFSHVPRKENKEADKLVNKILDENS